MQSYIEQTENLLARRGNIWCSCLSKYFFRNPAISLGKYNYSLMQVYWGGDGIIMGINVSFYENSLLTDFSILKSYKKHFTCNSLTTKGNRVSKSNLLKSTFNKPRQAIPGSDILYARIVRKIFRNYNRILSTMLWKTWH